MPNKKKISLLSSESIKDSMLMFTENADFGENVNLSISEVELVDETVVEGEGGTAKKAVKVRIKAIHAGRTDNHHIFASDKLKGSEELGTGAYSFTKPYNKPMLTHHDTYQDPVGRIIAAEYVEDEKGSIEIEVLVTDLDAIEKVKDGRYNTVSIGCRTNSAKCNVCGTERMEEWCEHRRGVEYDGIVCGWLLGDLWFHECSFVNVPADKEAQTISWEEVDFEKYSLNQEDAGEVIEEGTMPIAASEVIEEGAATNDEDDEPSTENVEEVATEEVGENVEENEEQPFAQIMDQGFDFESEFKSLNDKLDTVYQALNAEFNSTIEEKNKEVGKAYSAMNQSSKMLESAYVGLKDLYVRLANYTDAEVETFDLAWDIEHALEKINGVLDTIESETELQTDYSQTNNTKTVEEKFPTKKETVSSEDRFYRMISPNK